MAVSDVYACPHDLSDEEILAAAGVESETGGGVRLRNLESQEHTNAKRKRHTVPTYWPNIFSRQVCIDIKSENSNGTTSIIKS